MTTLRFLGDVPLWLGLLLALSAALGAWLYYRRERHDLPRRLRRWLPLLRVTAVFLTVLVLAGPVLHHRRVEGQLGRVVVFVDGSSSMGSRDLQLPDERKLLIARRQGFLPPGDPDDTLRQAATAQCDATTRWQRTEHELLHPDSGLLDQLAETHDVELVLLNGSEGHTVWSQLSSAPPPTTLAAEARGSWTDLGSAIAGRMTEGLEGSVESAPGGSRTAAVLLTDGRHNRGESPLQVARVLGRQAIPIHTVGFGADREPADLAVLGIEHPDMVFQKDRVRGCLLVKDQVPAGRPFVAQIESEGEVLWQQQLATLDTRLRRVEFELSVDKLVERLRGELDPAVRHHALPLTLRATLAPLEGETETSSNEAEFRFAAITQSYRILLIDGRSRWETRYLRNVFERDDQWQIDTILAGPGTDQPTLPRGEGPDRFPADRGGLFEYDLIVLGDVPADVFSENELNWIREFVEFRGGGLAFLDGHRSHLDFKEGHPLLPLLPVRRLDAPLDSAASELRLTPAGERVSILLLAASPEENGRLWSQLPPPHAIVPVEALAGTETLVETSVGQRVLPVMVTRSFGAGRVFYSAADETWRWRYKAADVYHQRFWNQLAQWVMPRPYAVSDDYVSLDTGPPSYVSGDQVDVRVRLRGVDGRPATGATVDALVWNDGRIASTVSLHADEGESGVYRGRTAPLEEGKYEVSVRASGFSQDALRARTSFVVQPPENRELQMTSCNDELLQEVASSSGGTFLHEEDFGKLVDLLRPLSSGRVIESDTLLWQSYWWFVAIVLLLSIEWFLRKRAGLL
ncbi:MAG: VWA domain-containing protein [Thermoguttaceae bacterium]